MAHGHDAIRSGHVVALHGHRTRDATCTDGGFYKSPTAASVVDSSKTLEIMWDTSCLTTSAVDIYLFAPSSSTPRIHEWQDVDYAYGSYNTTLDPAWWNSTKLVTLQLEIVESGLPTFMSSIPAGPMWNATYDGSDSATVSGDVSSGTIQDVNNFPKQNLSKGKIAAAVIMTLLAVAGIAAGVYIWRARKRGQEKRKRFSIAVDKRMSTVSSDWKPVTTAGASHAIRSSTYGDGNRSSSFSLGGSTTAVEGGQAGIGAQGLQLQTTEEDLSAPAMAQLRPGVRASMFSVADRQSRVSRISFAPDTRPSSEYRRTRAFHTGHVPPLPDTFMSSELSPTQTTGPFSLTADDIRAHMFGQDLPRLSLDAVAPALSMMHTGTSPTEESFVIPATVKMPEPELPIPPAPVLQAPSAPQSPILGAMPMPTIPGSMMTPDDMLRAYADRSLRSPPPTGKPSAPHNGNGMRVLYSPTATTTAPETFGLVSKPVPPPVHSLYADMSPTTHDDGVDDHDPLRRASTVSEDGEEHGMAH